MPPPDFSSYILPPQTSHQIFQTQILPTEFSTHPHPHPQTTKTTTSPPLAILAIGQTGAGKTRTTPLLHTHLLRTRAAPPLHLVADIYKAYHPSYPTFTSTAHASQATGPDARKWLAMAVEEAVRRGLDVLLESACRHAADFNALADMLLRGGYRVEVVVVAVPEGLSRLGILSRFYRSRDDDGTEESGGGLGRRLTPKRVHDESYKGLIKAVEWVDGRGEVDKVVVLRRGNLVAFEAERDSSEDGKERGFGGRVVEAVERERRRPLTEYERISAVADMQKLEGVEEAAEQLKEVRALLEPLMREGEVKDSEFPELKPLALLGDDV